MSIVPDGATISPDGLYWWDGTDWQPMPPDEPAGEAEPQLPAQEGPIILFEPKDATSTAAIFAHGVVGTDEIDPISGVTLGYYSPHGDTVDANITWAASAPTHAPQKTEDDEGGKWATYVLTTIGLPENNQAELADFANDNGIAVAYVVDPTDTVAVVSQLTSKGYSDIRGVHCREAIDSVADATFGDAVEMTHAELVAGGWTDTMEAITDETELAEGDALANASGEYFKIASVVEPKAKYQIVPYGA
jgi:hypothetical protein